MPKRKSNPVVTQEEFVKVCGDANTPTEMLREALAVCRGLCNASAYLYKQTWTALDNAVFLRSTEKVRLLLEHGADPEVTFQHCFRGRKKSTVLLWVCRDHQSSQEMVEILLEHKANVNAVDWCGRTPLWAACGTGRVDIVRLLVQNGAQVNAASANRMTPLLVNCKFKNCSIEVVRLLLDKGADVNAADEECGTALMGACRNGDLEVVRLLIQNGAQVNATSANRLTPLIANCKFENCSIEVVRLLLDQGADVNAADEERCTALMGACCNGDLEVMKLLLEKGANPNVELGLGHTVFSDMIGSATIEQVHLFLDYGADVNTKCHIDFKPLQRAIQNQDWQVADLLLERGASPHHCIVQAIREQAELPFLEKLLEKGASINEANIISDTALSVAAVQREDVALVKFLLENGADVNVRGDANGYATSQYSSTPWLKLVSRKKASLEMVRLFLEMGALVNDSDPKGNTPLMLAKELSVVKLILEQSAIDVNAVNKKGDTALIRHAKFPDDYPSTDVIQELLKNDNVDKNAKNAKGETALMVAAQLRRLDVVQLLLESDDNVAVNHVDNEGETALHKAVRGSNSMVPIVPPHFLVGSMAMKNDGQCLSIEGTWGVDEASSTQETSRNRFRFQRALGNNEPTKLNQLEQLGGTFVSSFDVRHMDFVDGDVELCFSRMSTSREGAPGSVIYRVQGFGPGITYGAVNVSGTVTLQLADPSDTYSASVKLKKTYQPGTGEDSRRLKNYCDKISGGEDALGNDCEPKQNMAVHKDNLAIAQLLLQHGVDVNMKDTSKEGNSPLMIACREHGGDLHMAKLLVSRGASVDAQNNNGKTSLILANEQGSLSMVKFLLQEGGALIALKRDP